MRHRDKTKREIESKGKTEPTKMDIDNKSTELIRSQLNALAESPPREVKRKELLRARRKAAVVALIQQFVCSGGDPKEAFIGLREEYSVLQKAFSSGRSTDA